MVQISVNVSENDPTRKEYNYKKFDIDAIENKISMFEDEPSDEETAAEENEKGEKVELDKDELMRKLRAAGLLAAATAFEKQLVEEEDPERQDDNPFIPEIIKNMKQLKEEAEAEKKAKEAQEKIE